MLQNNLLGELPCTIIISTIITIITTMTITTMIMIIITTTTLPWRSWWL